MSIYDYYTDAEIIGMDHPLFMVRTQSRIDAAWAADTGISLADALRTIRARMAGIFGEVPLALIDTTVSGVYAQHAANLAGCKA